MARPTWDEYFMDVAKVVGTRGTCDRGRNGCVIVKDKRILTTGYAGAPKGLPHCDDVGHIMHTVKNPDGTESDHCIRTTHAEQNAIVQAALHGISLEGATMYVKFGPCFACAKMIVNSGIKKIVCEKRYQRSKDTEELLKQAGIELVALKDEFEEY